MIGSLRGELKLRQAPVVIVECGSVGYEVETPMSTFLELPAIGEPVFLYTHLVVRETAHSLFGFATEAEKALFRLLLGVSGVGAKMALAILSGMTVADFERCVQLEDAAVLVKIPGVGKKTAERLVVELKDKMEGLEGTGPSPEAAPAGGHEDLVSALVHLGYSRHEAERGVVKALKDGAGDRFEELLRRTLRILSGR